MVYILAALLIFDVTLIDLLNACAQRRIANDLRRPFEYFSLILFLSNQIFYLLYLIPITWFTQYEFVEYSARFKTYLQN